MRIIFSKDRPAQLDLLLRSIDSHMEPEDTRVIWRASDERFRLGYQEVVSNPEQQEGEFGDELRALLDIAAWDDATVTFFCDDDIVFAPVDGDPGEALRNDEVLCHSLCLGRGNVKMRLPDGFPLWNWTVLGRHDFGYPCGVDGSTYRPEDVLLALGSDVIDNPTFVETVFLLRLSCFPHRPLMAAFENQSVVGVNVNVTSESSGCPSGRRFPQSAHELNERFLAGERIVLDAIDGAEVNSVHHEFGFQWA